MDLTDEELQLALSGACHTADVVIWLAREVKRRRDVQRVTLEQVKVVVREEIAAFRPRGFKHGSIEDVVVSIAARLDSVVPVLNAEERSALARARDFLDFNVDNEADRFSVDVLDRLLIAVQGLEGEAADRTAEQRALDVACYQEVKRERDTALAECRRLRSAMRGLVQSRSMRLDTHEGTMADPATPQDIARAVAGLTEVGRAFVVLSNDREADETYVQAAGTIDEGFIIERRDGGAGDHYRGDRRVSVHELGALLTGYLRAVPAWDHGLTWHRVRVDQSSPAA